MVQIHLTLLEKILIYVFILLAIFIFVKLSNIQIFGHKVIKLKYRIIITIIFPLILVILLIFGLLVASIILAIVFVMFILSFFKKK
ncbi:MAG: hypothetical protein NT139_03390 [Candidatus Woesearchaeota archaeon]|nr:hypothetical protein [Candidatus Woesearchaeota archaeon]